MELRRALWRGGAKEPSGASEQRPPAGVGLTARPLRGQGQSQSWADARRQRTDILLTLTLWTWACEVWEDIWGTANALSYLFLS